MSQHMPGTRRETHRREAALHQLLAVPRFEVMPLSGVLDRAGELPAGATVTVTASPSRGAEPTIQCAEALAARGFDAVPHLAARQIADEPHLTELLGRLHTAGVRDIFVVGGDASETTGAFPDGLSLLKAIDASGYRFSRVGVPSYPEGHPHIDDDTLWQALVGKQQYATYTVTQMCFAADAIARFAASASQRGVQLPISVGVPGAVAASKLLRMSMRIGVGDSARFLRGNRSTVRRMLNPRGYRPDGLLRGLASRMATGELQLAGVHIYTFNETGATMQWLRRGGRGGNR